MRFANAVKGAAVLTVGLIVSGCAVRVRPAAVVIDPIPLPSVVVERPVIDVHVSRPVVERKTVVVNPRPVVIKKETTVVVNKPGSGNSGNNGNHGNGNNGNHNGQDKFTTPAARGDNGNHYGQDKDKKGGVAKNE